MRTLSLLRSLLPTSIAIIGCGGISSGADALEYARAGASAVQLYTAFGYGGVGTARRIKDELAVELKNLGTTWVDISQEAIERLAWKAPAGSAMPHASDSERVDGVAALIREAEELMRMLDDMAARLEPPPIRSGTGSSGGGSEEDLHPAYICQLPPLSPPES